VVFSRSIAAGEHRFCHTVAIGLATCPVHLGRFPQRSMQVAPFRAMLCGQKWFSKAGSDEILTELRFWLNRLGNESYVLPQ
jgi:hypothetical protein